jgi:hypothetical protein
MEMQNMRILRLFTVLLLSFPFLVFTQNEDCEPPILTLTVAGESCSLRINTNDTPETTPEPGDEPETMYPIISLSDDCENVILQLVVSSNGTLWLGVRQPEEEDWQQFQLLEDDEFPPALDRRGRYIGCFNPNQGSQTCSVLWESDGDVYLIEIPIFVGAAYFAPTATAQPTATPTAPQIYQAPPDQHSDEAKATVTNKKKNKKKKDDGNQIPTGLPTGQPATP